MKTTEVRADVAVIGAGPAGIAAAVAAAEAGARVALIDEGVAPGGQIWRTGIHATPGGEARRWTSRLAASSATVLGGTSVVDVHRADGDRDGSVVLGERGGSPVRVIATSVVIATGARERFVPFPGWTLPNVVGVGGAQALLKSGTAFRGRRVVVAGSGPLMLPVAASLARSGAQLAAVAEQASTRRVIGFASSLWRTPSMLVQAGALRAAFIRTAYRTGTWVTAASGDSRVSTVTLTNGTRSWTTACDVLCVAYGLIPNTELARLIGCACDARGVMVDDRQATTISGVFCAGEPTGIGGVDLSLVEGTIAGRSAAGVESMRDVLDRRTVLRRYAARLAEAFALRDEVRHLADGNTVVCRCEDVRLRALKPEWSARQAKLYTRAGMGACQGRICGAALECLMGWTPDSVRVPLQPARLTTLLADVDSSDATRHV